MTKEDLTKYTENELSLRVFNIEYLYEMRFKKQLFTTLNELFIYTTEQLEVLKEDLRNELNEYDL